MKLSNFLWFSLTIISSFSIQASESSTTKTQQTEDEMEVWAHKIQKVQNLPFVSIESSLSVSENSLKIEQSVTDTAIKPLLNKNSISKTLPVSIEIDNSMKIKLSQNHQVIDAEKLEPTYSCDITSKQDLVKTYKNILITFDDEKEREIKFPSLEMIKEHLSLNQSSRLISETGDVFVIESILGLFNGLNPTADKKFKVKNEFVRVRKKDSDLSSLVGTYRISFEDGKTLLLDLKSSDRYPHFRLQGAIQKKNYFYHLDKITVPVKVWSL